MPTTFCRQAKHDQAMLSTIYQKLTIVPISDNMPFASSINNCDTSNSVVARASRMTHLSHVYIPSKKTACLSGDLGGNDVLWTSQAQLGNVIYSIPKAHYRTDNRALRVI